MPSTACRDDCGLLQSCFTLTTMRMTIVVLARFDSTFSDCVTDLNCLQSAFEAASDCKRPFDALLFFLLRAACATLLVLHAAAAASSVRVVDLRLTIASLILLAVAAERNAAFICRLTQYNAHNSNLKGRIRAMKILRKTPRREVSLHSQRMSYLDRKVDCYLLRV